MFGIRPSTGRRVRRIERKLGAFFVVMATIAALFGIATSSPASAASVGPGVIGGFEVDGNEVVDTPGQHDWKNVPSTILVDASNPDDGLQGTSKENDPLNWLCQTSSPFINPPKDNLLRAYLSPEITVSSALLDLAFVREKVTGDTHVNFELNKGQITFNSAGVNGPCPYTGRLPGDLLLTFDFPGSGTADVNARTWEGSAWSAPTSLGQSVVAATDNASAIAAADDIGGADIPTRAFGEAAIDLIALDQVTPGQSLGCPGFGHVSIRTRSSGQTFDSALQDIMGGPIDLSTCGKVIVHKTDDTGAPLAGAQFGLYTSNADAVAHTNAVGTCTSIADGSCTFDKVDPAKSPYFVSEISAPANYSLDPTVVGPITVGFRETVDVTSHTFVDPRDTGFVKVTKALVDENGAPVTPSSLATLNGATFQLYDDANNNGSMDAGEAVNLWNSATPAGCTINNNLGFCTFGPVATGAYRLTETAVPPQTTKGPDVNVTVTKGTVQTAVNVTYTNSLSPLQISLHKDGPATSNIGDTFTYTFDVTTTGPPLHNIDLVELAPDRCNVAASPLTFVSGDTNHDTILQVGETWHYTCGHLTTPADHSSLVNNAKVTGTDTFGRTVSATDTHTVTILYPNLQVVKTALVSPVDPGSSAGFSIVTTNLGPGKALNVVLTDTLPSGTWTIGGPDGGACSGTSGTMTCNFGTMDSLASKTVTISRPATIADCPSIPNTATVATTYGADKINIDTNLSNNTSSASVAINCTDVSILKTAEASPISAGDTARFTVTVSNLGTVTAKSVTVSDAPLPAGLTWSIDTQSSGMGCTIGANLNCGPFDLLAGASKAVTISAVTTPANCTVLPNTATVAATNDTNSENNTSSASITVLCPNLGITKAADAFSVSSGDPIGFTVTVTNGAQPGGTAKAVVLTDPLPSGVTWTVSPPVNGCGVNAGVLTCTIGDMTAGASFSVHVSAATDAAPCKAYVNTATADGSNTDPVQASATTTVLCPNLGITKDADADSVSAGDSIGFTITVSNGVQPGGTAKAVVLTDPLPSGVTWTISPPVDGCSITTGILTCTARDLAPGASLVVHITATTTQADCKTYTNTATADGSNTSPVTATDATSVLCPGLNLVKTADKSPVNAGETIGFVITVSNVAGPNVGTAKAVVLTDPLPSGVTWSIASPAPTGCAIASGTLTCTARDLAPGESLSVHVTATTTQANCATFTNTATADGSNTDPLTATASTTVQCPHLTTTKTADAATVDAGNQIGFTITTTNVAGEGVGVAKGVTIHDPLPSGTGINWTVSSTSGVTGSCAISAGVLACGPFDLAPGESFSVHVVSSTPGGLTNAALPAACKVYDNTATASATNADPVTASASTEVICPLAIAIVKDGPATANRGDTVTYTFKVTNIGKVDLVTVDLSDAKCDAGTIKLVSKGDGDAVLNIGESWTFSCTRVIRADDPNPLPNTATVVGSDVLHRTTTAQSSHVININLPVEVLPEVIPRTGANSSLLLIIAGILLALGGLFLGLSDGQRLLYAGASIRRTRRRRNR